MLCSLYVDIYLVHTNPPSFPNIPANVGQGHGHNFYIQVCSCPDDLSGAYPLCRTYETTRIMLGLQNGYSAMALSTPLRSSARSASLNGPTDTMIAFQHLHLRANHTKKDRKLVLASTFQRMPPMANQEDNPMETSGVQKTKATTTLINLLLHRRQAGGTILRILTTWSRSAMVRKARRRRRRKTDGKGRRTPIPFLLRMNRKRRKRRRRENRQRQRALYRHAIRTSFRRIQKVDCTVALPILLQKARRKTRRPPKRFSIISSKQFVAFLLIIGFPIPYSVAY